MARGSTLTLSHSQGEERSQGFSFLDNRVVDMMCGKGSARKTLPDTKDKENVVRRTRSSSKEATKEATKRRTDPFGSPPQTRNRTARTSSANSTRSSSTRLTSSTSSVPTQVTRVTPS